MAQQRILIGDTRERLFELPTSFVQCCVTSPPYYGLRDYGVPGQIGLEPTLSEYITNMVDVFREVRRVLRDDGTCFLNIGDSYAGGGGFSSTSPSNQPGGSGFASDRPNLHKALIKGGRSLHDLKPKDLMLVPERLALALQDDGWWVRSRIIWAKKACMPESVLDRPTNAHEHIWLLTKAARYFYDAEAVREEWADEREGRPGGHKAPERNRGGRTDGYTTPPGYWEPPEGRSGRNQRNVWHLGPEPFPDAHFATFPTEIPRRAIKAGTSEHGCCEACGAPWVRQVERSLVNTEGWGKATKDHHGSVQGSDAITRNGQGRAGNSVVIHLGWEPSCICDAGVIPCTVLDPFLGSGTTLMVADQLGRHGIGIELNAEYAAMAERRIRGDAPLFAEVEVA